jgi:hypothetical protein
MACSMAIKCCQRSRGGHREGAGQGREGRGAPERRVDDEAGGEFRDGGVRRRGGSSDGWRRRVWGPAAPVREGEAGVSSNLGMVRLGGCSPERGKTTAALGEIQREGEASGGRRQRSGCGSDVERCGARAGNQRGVGDGSADEWWVGRFVELALSAARLRGKNRRGGGPAAGVPLSAGRRRGAWP